MLGVVEEAGAMKMEETRSLQGVYILVGGIRSETNGN